MQGVFEFCRDRAVASKWPERVFFAVLLDGLTTAGVNGFAGGFIRKNRLIGRPVKAGRLHLSLHYVGDGRLLRTKFLYAARQAGRAVSMRPFEARLTKIRSFEGSGRGRPLVLIGRGAGLFELHRLLGAAMATNGLRAATSFEPHVTLFYGMEPVPLQAVAPIPFIVNEFALVHGEPGLPHYNILDRWALRD